MNVKKKIELSYFLHYFTPQPKPDMGMKIRPGDRDCLASNFQPLNGMSIY